MLGLNKEIRLNDVYSMCSERRKRILQKQKLLGTLNINISASLREEKWRWLHFHSWCEHSWGAWASPVSFRATRAEMLTCLCRSEGAVIILGVKEDRYLSGFEFVSAVMLRVFFCTQAPLYTSPNLDIKMQIIQANHVCYICNRRTGRRITDTSSSEYGWSDELTIIIQSTKGG